MEDRQTGHARRLLYNSPDVSGPTILSLDEERTLIGRHAICHVQVHDNHVARLHVEIQWDGDGARIVHLGSRNPVRVNGGLLQGSESADLSHGDVLRVGHATVVYLDEPDPDADCTYLAFLAGDIPAEVLIDWCADHGLPCPARAPR